MSEWMTLFAKAPELFDALPYDWHAAARTALENGRPDWAEWIRTGRAYV